MNNLIMKLKQFKFKFMRNLIRKYGRFMGGTEKTLTGDDIKIDFERDILKLLKKYEVLDNTHKLQKIEIIVDVKEYPVIKLETLII